MTIAGSLPAATLADFTAAEFEQIVLANASRRRRNPQMWEALLSPQVIERTHSALVDAVQRNTAAMTARREVEQSRQLTADTHTTAEEHALGYLDWRRRANSFNQLVGSALSEVNKRRQHLAQQADNRTAQQYRQQIRELALAIADHQRAAMGSGDGPAQPHDSRLWECLDAVRIPHGRSDTPTPLRVLIDAEWCPASSTA